jgi:hypothetical protein
MDVNGSDTSRQAQKKQGLEKSQNLCAGCMSRRYAELGFGGGGSFQVLIGVSDREKLRGIERSSAVAKERAMCENPRMKRGLPTSTITSNPLYQLEAETLPLSYASSLSRILRWPRSQVKRQWSLGNRAEETAALS